MPTGYRSRRRLNYRAFYLTICIAVSLAALSSFADLHARYRLADKYGLAQREVVAGLDPGRLVKKDEECRLVHHAEDKCAFITANCPDEEAGLLSYLSLYYCVLPKAQPVAFMLLVSWLGLLFSTIGIAASDFFCINLSTIASILGMSESMAGVTFLAFGNGSPDVFSTFAAMNSHSGSLAVGELIGAAGFITAVVAGSMALVREFKVAKKTFVRDVGFFIVATTFSMSFLADGALRLWECCVMIGFYLFYVVLVVVWHWYVHRRNRHRERLRATKGGFYGLGAAETAAAQEDGGEGDHEVHDGLAEQTQSLLQRRTTDDVLTSDLRDSPVSDPAGFNFEDRDRMQERRVAAEMNNSMRVSQHKTSRRNTINPIRPSLLGALEFRSILSTLQKSKSQSARPIHLRRYSDDPRPSATHSAGASSHAIDLEDDEGQSISSQSLKEAGSGRPSLSTRVRAVSLNNATQAKSLQLAAGSSASIPDVGVIASTPGLPHYLDIPIGFSSPHIPRSDTAHSNVIAGHPASPTISISPSPTEDRSRATSPKKRVSNQPQPDRLNLPDGGFPGARHLRQGYLDKDPSRWRSLSSADDSQPLLSQLTIPRTKDTAGALSSSPIINFPDYADVPVSGGNSEVPTLSLPEPHILPRDTTIVQESSDDESFQVSKPINWWPYRFLPDPRVVFSTLFPTLTMWKDKGYLERIISILSTPSILLLSLTLPVVESEFQEDDEEHTQELSGRKSRAMSSTTPRLPADSPVDELEAPEWTRYRRSTLSREHLMSPRSPALHHLGGTASVAVSVENLHNHSHTPPRSPGFPFPADVDQEQAQTVVDGPMSMSSETTTHKDWNRWLIIVQLYTAPLFVMFIVWANSAGEATNARLLLQLVLYSLIGSTVLLAVLLLTTTAERPPKYRFLLCFLGFVVAIAWISTIANEVVGVLKCLGIILDISDAILGLTIFAVGNSLGDLVADVTVARLGYPVMALSACFGGPMLNILLGIGVSGLYMTIKEADHKHAKHPGRPLKYKPYEIEVSATLMISAVTLLVTLIGLLVAVPANGWIMSRRIGWCLIAVWVAGTVVNLVVELTGVWGAGS